MENKRQLFLDAMNYRYAVKSFDASKKISAEDFNYILEAGRLSPSSFGLEPWKLIILQDKDLQQKIYPYANGGQNSLNGASHYVVFIVRKKHDLEYDSDYISHMLRDIKHLTSEVEKGYRDYYRNFSINDFKTMENDKTAMEWAARQAYIAMGNMLTAAAYIGIDSCPIEGFKPTDIDRILGDEAKLYDTKEFGVAVMAGFGYRAEDPRHPKTRRPLDEIVIWK